MRLLTALTHTAWPSRLHDPVRLGAQAAAAAAVTFGIMTTLNWPHLTWALISSLFVLHRNSDATRRSLGDRLKGTLIGSAIGLAAIALLPSASMASVRITAVAFVAMIVAILRPNQNYVLVAAVAVALEAGDPPWTGALERIRAIALGAGMAWAASRLVWREPARRRALLALATAVGCCRDLCETLACGSGAAKASERRREVDAAYHQARGIALSRIGDCPEQQQRALWPVAARIDWLWHDLLLVHRMSDEAGTGRTGAGKADLLGAPTTRALEHAAALLGARGPSAVEGHHADDPGKAADPRAGKEASAWDFVAAALDEDLRRLHVEARAAAAPRSVS